MGQLFVETDQAAAKNTFDNIIRQQIAAYHTAQLIELKTKAIALADANAKFNALSNPALYAYTDTRSISTVLENFQNELNRVIPTVTAAEHNAVVEPLAQLTMLQNLMKHKYNNVASLPPQLRATRAPAPASTEPNAAAADAGPNLNEFVKNIVATKAADGWRLSKADVANNDYEVAINNANDSFTINGTHDNFNLVPTDGNTYAACVEFARLCKEQDDSFEFTIIGGDETQRWDFLKQAIQNNIFIKDFNLSVYEGKEDYQADYENFASRYAELKTANEAKAENVGPSTPAPAPTAPAAAASPTPPRWTSNGNKRKAMQREAEKRRKNMPKEERKQYKKFTDDTKKKKMAEFLNETEGRESLVR